MIDVKKRFVDGDYNTKRKIISLICSDLTLKDKGLLYEVSEPFRVITEIVGEK